ncbi:MAG: DUF885 domain-containing protein [Deltaproteobacteria bacterium]|nr:MAG: DUF885 domain-containing protein [Deltaproteobacteria bacterium]
MSEIATGYFSFMARNFPVMCASDEFYFFPRSSESVEYSGCLDQLGREEIEQSFLEVKGFLKDLENLKGEDLNLEEKIDLDLLRQSILTFLREYGQVRIWQKDPCLYLKIAMIGQDQALSTEKWEEKVLNRLTKIPDLLHQGELNLTDVSNLHREAALEMLAGSIDFLAATKDEFNYKSELETANLRAIESLEKFRDFLRSVSTTDVFAQGEEILAQILAENYGSNRSLEEVHEIATREYQGVLNQIENLSLTIDKHKNWQEVLADYRVEVDDPVNLIELYRREVSSLRNFLEKNDIVPLPSFQEIKVAGSPIYLEPLRSSASYSSPPTNTIGPQCFFYIKMSEMDLVQSDDNPHKEYLFMTAHETYPGHHLLDMSRKAQPNPVRRQIESPLFYEGWACYGEQLIDETGYSEDPYQKLICRKRQLWRSLRALLDIGLHTGKLGLAEARERLAGLGLSRQRAYQQVRNYALTYGYQLCYLLGRYEIMELRKKFADKISLKEFHNLLLKGGQIPFKWIEKRIDKNIKCQSPKFK